MKTIFLRGKRGGEAIVDDADYAYLSQFKWYLLTVSKGLRARRNKTTGYAARWKNKATVILMHREILSAPRGTQIDHINHNGLDNRRSNLRFCSHRENVANSTRAPGKTGFRGVYETAEGRFAARAWKNNRKLYIGRFNTAEDAARARDAVAKRLLGEFAVLNFPQATDED